MLYKKEILNDEILKAIHNTSNTSILLKNKINIGNTRSSSLENSIIFGAFVFAAIYVAIATIAVVEVAGYVHFALKTYGPRMANNKTKIETKISSPAVNLFLDKTGLNDDIENQIMYLLEDSLDFNFEEKQSIEKILKGLYNK